MSENAPTASDIVLSRQRAFLLNQLAIAPEGILSQAEANKAIPTQIKEELKLAPVKAINELRQTMVSNGWLVEAKVGKNVMYSITEEGKEHLRTLERYVPLLSAGGKLNPPADDRIRVAREVYLLNALSHAPSQTISKADLELGFGGKGKPKVAELEAKHPHLAPFRDQNCLGLNPATTRTVLSELAIRGEIAVHRTADSESYALTATGVELLARLRSECPVLPPTGKSTPAPNESVRRGREAFLLLKLLQSAKYTFWESDAATGSYPKPLKLNHATAWQVRNELATEGQITTHWDGKEGSFTLTPSGKRYLATLSFDALGEVRIKGSALTELLAAAREGTKPAPRETLTPTDQQTPPTAPTDAQLETAVMDIFLELLRERFTVTGMVPIHEIRREIASRFGATAASHAILDEALLGLRRAKKVWLVSISDRSRATHEQLQDSVPGVGETFFYVEKSHAPTQGG